ncbi:pentatricopeptide repeat (PPR) superfamily protein [Actinidia rufa]|uniref:Pentatricopeptide repeat (PPR) superfamily protein n=1 Tax=Actinidia rufa TaxID=165716 RepID=A0A7J0ESM0_9ERIC|nr:pentatricopeptide repeat (PPR) superfamily protein [Actinidia rufa]
MFYNHMVSSSYSRPNSIVCGKWVGWDYTELFDEMPDRDLVSWNSLIACYSQAGLHYEALNVCNQMRMLNIGFDGFTFVSLLSSCAHLGALSVGVRLHRLASEKGMLGNVFVGNALIDKYAKCGNLGGALCVFNGMKRRDVSTWNSMIVGYGVHGQGNQAISFFKKHDGSWGPV